MQAQTQVDNVFEASIDKISEVINSRESDVVIKANVPSIEVTETKDTDDTDDVKEDANNKLDILIKKEVPKEFPIPDFKKPNPIKSKSKNDFKRMFGLDERMRPNFPKELFR
jgi:hypothetical protein